MSRVIMSMGNGKIAFFTQFKSWIWVWKDIIITIKAYIKCHKKGKIRLWFDVYPQHFLECDKMYKVSYLMSKDKDKSIVRFRIFGFKVEEL